MAVFTVCLTAGVVEVHLQVEYLADSGQHVLAVLVDYQQSCGGGGVRNVEEEKELGMRRRRDVLTLSL